jgi:hypothetical protein
MIMDNNRFRISHSVLEKESISRLFNSLVRQTHMLSIQQHESWSIVVFLHVKGFSVKAKYVHTEFVWVLGSADHESIWPSPEDEAPQRARMMLTVVWNPHGFCLIDVQPKDSEFNVEHYISRVLSLLPEIFCSFSRWPKETFLWFALTMPDFILPKRWFCFEITIPSVEHLILLIRQIWPSHISGCSCIWKKSFKGVYSANPMNYCALSMKFWGKSVMRLCMRYFKKEWSDCKNVLIEIVNLLGNV